MCRVSSKSRTPWTPAQPLLTGQPGEGRDHMIGSIEMPTRGGRFLCNVNEVDYFRRGIKLLRKPEYQHLPLTLSSAHPKLASELPTDKPPSALARDGWSQSLDAHHPRHKPTWLAQFGRGKRNRQITGPARFDSNPIDVSEYSLLVAAPSENAGITFLGDRRLTYCLVTTDLATSPHLGLPNNCVE